MTESTPAPDIRSGTTSPDGAGSEPYARLHKVLVGVCAFFMAYLIVESVVLLPFMLIRFGWQ